MTTLKIAYRNIYRQKRRTILTVLTMMGGFVLASISIAWSDGVYSSVIDLFTRNKLGHIQIHGEGYLDKPTLYNTISGYEEIGDTIAAMDAVVNWAPRIYSAGLASVGDNSAGVRLMGIDPQREAATTSFDKKLVAGKLFGDTTINEAILGTALAKALEAQVGDELVILSQGADGSIANDIYTIVGLVKTDDVIDDRNTVYLTMTEAQELLVLHNQSHEIAIVIDNLHRVRRTADAIQKKLDRPELAVAPWQEFARQFYQAMQVDRQGTWVSLFIILLIVAVGVFNTILMTVLERTREYGVLRAIGVRPGQVSRLVFYEVAVMAVLSAIIGTVVALGCNYYLSIEGLNIGEFSYGGVTFSNLYSEINFHSYWIPGITVFVSALLVSIFPALRAARTAPARAMRIH